MRNQTTKIGRVDQIVTSVAARFPTFGGGRGSDWNPIANALKNTPPQFAAGVDVREVVEEVLQLSQNKNKRTRTKAVRL